MRCLQLSKYIKVYSIYNYYVDLSKTSSNDTENNRAGRFHYILHLQYDMAGAAKITNRMARV